MKKLTYIFFAISLLLFSCKAMDFAMVKDEDNFVSIQYYNFKPITTQFAGFWRLNDVARITHQVFKDTLFVNYQLNYSKKAVTIPEAFSDSLGIRTYCGSSVGYPVFYRIVEPYSFYNVHFPILEVENVERKDLGKWYRSFSTIIVNVERWNYSQKFTFTYPRSFLSASNYTRP